MATANAKSNTKKIMKCYDNLETDLGECDAKIKDLENVIARQMEIMKNIVDKLNIKLNDNEKIIRSRKVNALYKRIDKDALVVATQVANVKNKVRGSIRVGKLASTPGNRVCHPKTDGYINIVVTSSNKSGVGSELSPFKLSDGNGHFMENIWQFSKVYAFVPDYMNTKIGWECTREIHVDKNTQKIKPSYYKWRLKGMEFGTPVTYPVGVSHRQYCKYTLWPESHLLEDAVNMTKDTPYVTYKYVPARIKVYCPVYITLAKQCDDYKTINDLLNEGYNVQILDVDGPTNTESSIEINEKNIKTLLADINHPFGHGYALACALLGHEDWIYDFDVSKMNDDNLIIE